MRCVGCARRVPRRRAGRCPVGESVTLHPRPALWRLILIGAVGGLLSGTFGVGGGIVVVPLLMALAHFDQRRASATSLLAIVPSGIAGGITYLAHGYLDAIAVVAVSAGAVVGALIGSALLRRLPIWWLRWGFIVLLLGVAVRMILLEPERGQAPELSVGLVVAYVVIGLAMGLCSGLFGIGGAIVAVPALIAIVGLNDLIAKGSTLLVVVVTSAAGTAMNHRGRLVDWRAGSVVGVVAAAASVLGAFLAVGMPPRLSAVSVRRAARGGRRPAHVPRHSGPASPRQRHPRSAGIVFRLASSQHAPVAQRIEQLTTDQ